LVISEEVGESRIVILNRERKIMDNGRLMKEMKELQEAAKNVR
jgi:hypothetical protein